MQTIVDEEKGIINQSREKPTILLHVTPSEDENIFGYVLGIPIYKQDITFVDKQEDP